MPYRCEKGVIWAALYVGKRGDMGCPIGVKKAYEAGTSYGCPINSENIFSSARALGCYTCFHAAAGRPGKLENVLKEKKSEVQKRGSDM